MLAGFDLSTRCKQQASLLRSYSCMLLERLINYSGFEILLLEYVF